MNSLKKIVYHSIAYLYSSLFIVYIPIIYLKKLKRSLKNASYRKRWAERFANTSLRLKDCIWIHSVSVGESISAEPLVKKFLQEYPNEKLNTQFEISVDMIESVDGWDSEDELGEIFDSITSIHRWC